MYEGGVDSHRIVRDTIRSRPDLLTPTVVIRHNKGIFAALTPSTVGMDEDFYGIR